ncbi:AT-hook motif nuclear-localized protein 17-like [Senna tora]|uniref:AT-hook motif nuclear-localized protein 17-like n=1 Tax=Senna tora TaxID=362788 RepID=A0A834T5H9_9FABA|nr:AT-hook motif nuclear-localized protein 17-like [Senna tora]
MDLPSKNSPSLPSVAADVNGDNLKPKKQRGRPKGSKNKPKSQPQIFSANNSSLRDSIDVIHVPPGADILDCLREYSHSRQKNITVLFASGLVSQVSVRPFLTYSPPHMISVPGPVPVLFFSGSILLEITSPHSLSICVPGCQGQIVYGLIGGSVIARSIVTIVIVANKDEDKRSNSGDKIEFKNYMMIGDKHEVDNNKPNAITISTPEVKDNI